MSESSNCGGGIKNGFIIRAADNFKTAISEKRLKNDNTLHMKIKSKDTNIGTIVTFK